MPGPAVAGRFTCGVRSGGAGRVRAEAVPSVAGHAPFVGGGGGSGTAPFRRIGQSRTDRTLAVTYAGHKHSFAD
ncbi:hypothetical protein GCM10009677_58670 [Sphaerisporangium rubeum]